MKKKELELLVNKLGEALSEAQQDINWMTNSDVVLHRFCFDYLDNAVDLYEKYNEIKEKNK